MDAIVPNELRWTISYFSEMLRPSPTSCSEICILNIPKIMNLANFTNNLLRFGHINEICFRIDEYDLFTGYGYVKYFNDDDAVRAVKVLSHFYIEGVQLDINFSYEKTQLFLTNIPICIREDEIKAKLQELFPKSQHITLNYSIPNPREYAQMKNLATAIGVDEMMIYRACLTISALVQFASHTDAVQAKHMIKSETVRLWNSDITIAWDKNNREINEYSYNSVFINNFDTSLKKYRLMDLILPFIPHTTVLKLSIWTTTAYIDFTNRESALEFMKILQYNCGEKIDIGWTKSKAIDELHWFDFDTMLRLKCIANNWEVPIILFGSYYKEQSLQYCAVVLRNITDNYTEARCIFCIMHTDQLVDIHSRVCETVCTLIDGIGIFPDVNYLIDVQFNTAHILGCVVQLNNFIQVIGTRTSTENNNFEFDINELVDLSWAVAILCQMDGDVLIERYYKTFQTNNVKTYLPYVSVLGNRLFGTIIPNYRRKLPIGHDLNDTKLHFALCHKSTCSNYNPDRPYTPIPQSQVQCINKNFKYVSFELQPLDLRHDRTSSQLKYLLFGDTRSYHPEKKLKIDIRNFIGTSYKNSFRTVHKADRPPPQ